MHLLVFRVLRMMVLATATKLYSCRCGNGSRSGRSDRTDIDCIGSQHMSAIDVLNLQNVDVIGVAPWMLSTQDGLDP